MTDFRAAVAFLARSIVAIIVVVVAAAEGTVTATALCRGTRAVLRLEGILFRICQETRDSRNSNQMVRPTAIVAFF